MRFSKKRKVLRFLSLQLLVLNARRSQEIYDRSNPFIHVGNQRSVLEGKRKKIELEEFRVEKKETRVEAN